MASTFTETGAGNLTVEEMCLGAAMLLKEVADQAVARAKLTLSSGATLSGSSLNEAMLLFWHSQAMVELSQLRFWLDRNDYGRSLTVRATFGTYGHISTALKKLIDLMGLVLDYAEQLDLVLSPDIETDYGIEQAFA